MTKPDEPDRRPAEQDAQNVPDVPEGPDAETAEAAEAAAPDADGPREADADVPRDADASQDAGTAEGSGAGADADTSRYRDRAYRSGAGLAGGVLLLALIAWLGIDALVRGQGRTPWLSLATMLLLVPLVVAFTVRPAVFAGPERLRIRNPFRVITLPWGAVAELRSGYSNEVVAHSGRKYQLWAIPVSMRARKRASRQELGVTASAAPRGLFGGGGRTVSGTFGGTREQQAAAAAARAARPDQSMDDLRELAGIHGDAPAAQGEPEVHWSYEVIAPALAGAVLLVVLLAM
jgi:hypothetical protein